MRNNRRRLCFALLVAVYYAAMCSMPAHAFYALTDSVDRFGQNSQEQESLLRACRDNPGCEVLASVEFSNLVNLAGDVESGDPDAIVTAFYLIELLSDADGLYEVETALAATIIVDPEMFLLGVEKHRLSDNTITRILERMPLENIDSCSADLDTLDRRKTAILGVSNPMLSWRRMQTVRLLDDLHRHAQTISIACEAAAASATD